MSALQAGLWTALPCIVQNFYGQKVDAQPAINGIKRAKDGTTSSIQLPLLLDCPVLWQGGGGMTATFPIEKDDECLVIIASRCIDQWYEKGGVQDSPELRMHDLSDGFALVGLRSVPRAFTVSTTAARITSDDGSFYWEMNPSTKAIKAVASGGINLNGATIDSSGNIATPGNVHSQGTVTGDTDVVAAGKSGKGHTHTSASPGSPTSPPN
jgi:hypothetical protein